jgi:hypothetical protein
VLSLGDETVRSHLKKVQGKLGVRGGQAAADPLSGTGHKASRGTEQRRGLPN